MAQDRIKEFYRYWMLFSRHHHPDLLLHNMCRVRPRKALLSLSSLMSNSGRQLLFWTQPGGGGAPRFWFIPLSSMIEHDRLTQSSVPSSVIISGAVLPAAAPDSELPHRCCLRCRRCGESENFRASELRVSQTSNQFTRDLFVFHSSPQFYGTNTRQVNIMKRCNTWWGDRISYLK